VDGTVEGTGHCIGCDFCLLAAGLVDPDASRRPPA
jgi:hypothetical protein